MLRIEFTPFYLIWSFKFGPMTVFNDSFRTISIGAIIPYCFIISLYFIPPTISIGAVRCKWICQWVIQLSYYWPYGLGDRYYLRQYKEKYYSQNSSWQENEHNQQSLFDLWHVILFPHKIFILINYSQNLMDVFKYFANTYKSLRPLKFIIDCH